MTHFHNSCACVGETEKALCLRCFKFIFVSLFWGGFGQELFRKACHAFVVSRKKGENWDVTNFKMGISTRFQVTVNGLYHKCIIYPKMYQHIFCNSVHRKMSSFDSSFKLNFVDV